MNFGLEYYDYKRTFSLMLHVFVNLNPIILICESESHNPDSDAGFFLNTDAGFF